MNICQRSARTPAIAHIQNLSAAADDGKKGGALNHADVPIVDYDDPDYLPLPEYPFRPNEPLDVKKQRCVFGLCNYITFRSL